jgi:hypothetical protein
LKLNFNQNKKELIFISPLFSTIWKESSLKLRIHEISFDYIVFCLKLFKQKATRKFIQKKKKKELNSVQTDL